jgi:flagellar export protein FliJ
MAFKLETLLKMRINNENSIKKEFSEIQNHLISQQKRLQFMENVGNKTKVNWNQAISGQIDPNMLEIYNQFFDGIESQKKFQQSIISEIVEKADAKRLVLAKAMQNRKTLEILKEKQLKEEKDIRLKTETAMLDEVAAIQWNRRSK